MSNSNRKIKAEDVVIKADSKAAQDSAKAAKKEKLYKLMLWLGVLCSIAYVCLLIAFVTKGRGLGRIHTGKMIMLASAITGGLGAAMLTGCTIMNKTKKMLSIGVALIGVSCVALYVTYSLLLSDYSKGTDMAGAGSTAATIMALSLVAGILLMIISAIRTKVEEKIARKKARE